MNHGFVLIQIFHKVLQTAGIMKDILLFLRFPLICENQLNPLIQKSQFL